MADRFGIEVHAKACIADMKAMDKRVDRGTMWALRETGRVLGRRARAQSPVYNGDRPDVERGLLRKSIKSSRRIKKFDRVQSLTVGPRGQRVHLYAAKAEASTGFMARAYRDTVPLMGEIHRRSWQKSMDRV